MNRHTSIVLGNGFLLVTPDFPVDLEEDLRYWHRTLGVNPRTMRRESSGQYRDLYTAQTEVDPVTNVRTRTLTTMAGFAHRVKQVLHRCGWTFDIVDKRLPMPKPDVDAAMVGLRPYQYNPAYKMVMSGGGIAACPTGWGKTRLLTAVMRAFPHEALKLRGTPLTVVATPDKDITEKDYRDIVELLPDREVGLVMSGRSKFSEDIQVATLDSLHRIQAEDVGIVIVDEVHSAASDTRADALLAFNRAAMWGVSATPDGRFDGRDKVTEGIFGPPVVTISYQDGVDCGALVPITVYWVTCPEPSIGIDRYLRYSSRLGKYRHGVWANENRNALIGRLLKEIPDEMQTLCILQYIEHMNNIAVASDDVATLVHGETDPKKLMGYPHVHSISTKERRELYGKVESAEIRKVISTHVYKQGVNFPELSVVINAGGGGSDIVAKQIPGRESRKTASKESSILIDFWHPWDVCTTTKVAEVNGKNVPKTRTGPGPIHSDDKSREKAYRNLGFKSIWIDDISQIPFLREKSKMDTVLVQ